MTPTSTMARPAAKVTLPSQSMEPGVRVPTSRSRAKPQMVPITPIGTLIKKTRRQLIPASRPPITRPRKEPAMAAIMLMPSASPRWLAGKASVRMAAELDIIMAPPTAWTMRSTISSSAPVAPWLQTSESPMAATVKMAKPRL